MTDVVITNTATPGNATPSGAVSTYNSISIGAAAADRIVVLNCVQEGGALFTANSATIDFGTGPVSMTACQNSESFGVQSTRQFWALAPTGTTATFVITYSSTHTAANASISVYRVVGSYSTGPIAAGGDSTTDVDATDPLTVTVDIPYGGAFLAVAESPTETDAKTWSGASEDLDYDAGSHRHTTAISTAPGNSQVITCTGGVNGEDAVLAYCVFASQARPSQMLALF